MHMDSCDTAHDEACCGPPTGPVSSLHEKPGYKLCGFVADFINTPIGPVARVKTELGSEDLWISIKARSGFGRNRLQIAPGLYAFGHPTADAPVLVTANYHLGFNILRKELKDINAWLLVIDTRGINVWCAAGKGTFSDKEVAYRVNLVQLNRVVNHRELILPQLGATGVSAKAVKNSCGFSVKWGPIRAEDIKPFLSNGKKADTEMRRVTFTMGERLLVVPVEFYHLVKPSLWVFAAIFILSGIGVDIFSFSASWSRGLTALLAYGAGIFAVAVLVPALLPWIPGRAFSLKGIISGLVLGGISCWIFRNGIQGLEILAMVLLATAVSSYLAMNFTGSTPYTSPSGVEKEMRKAIPAQALSVLVAAAAWVTSGFTG